MKNEDEQTWEEAPEAALQRLFELPATNQNDFETIKKMLCNEIEHLIKHNFEKLLHILYRIDINEQKAVDALQQPNAAEIISDLIIERQIQKVKSRKENK